MNEQTKKEQNNFTDDISPAQVLEKIEKAIESDKNLSLAFFYDIQEVSLDKKCYRTFRAQVEIRARIPVGS